MTSRTVPPSLASGELWRGLAGGDPRKRIARPALLGGSLRDPTLAEAERVRAARSDSSRSDGCASSSDTDAAATALTALSTYASQASVAAAVFDANNSIGSASG